jgi:type III pantothenate kinase
VISTGGLAPVFDGATGGLIEQIVPDITMRGLYEIWRRNGGRQ